MSSPFELNLLPANHLFKYSDGSMFHQRLQNGVKKITEMMTQQLLSNTNYLTDCNKTLDLVFLKLALHKNNKNFILVTPTRRQARDFSNDLVQTDRVKNKTLFYVQEISKRGNLKTKSNVYNFTQI